MKKALSHIITSCSRYITSIPEKLHLWNISGHRDRNTTVDPQTQSDSVQNISINIPSLADQIITSPPPTNSSLQTLNLNTSATQGHDTHKMWLKYLLFVGGVCYAAVSATLQALQGTRPLGATSKIVYAALLVSFTFFVLSVYIRTNYPRTSAIAVHVGSLFGFAAFVVALFSSLLRRH